MRLGWIGSPAWLSLSFAEPCASLNNPDFFFHHPRNHIPPSTVIPEGLLVNFNLGDVETDRLFIPDLIMSMCGMVWAWRRSEMGGQLCTPLV